MLICAFLLSSVALILQAILFPHISILAFSPFLALVILRQKLNQALTLSLLAGMIMDLISNDPMGVHALNYVIVTALLFKVRKHFLHDEPFHLSVFTAIVSSVSTVLALVLLFLFDRRVPIEGKWFLEGFVGMPVIDGLYAFVWFAAPLSLFSKITKMWALFWLKQKRHSRTSH